MTKHLPNPTLAELRAFVDEVARRDCWCDEPEPGEYGVIVCDRCRARALLPAAEAAPELLAALESCFERITEHSYRGRVDPLELARAAIAKAKGEPAER